MSDKKMRRAQTISPFGVGALFDLNGEGFSVASIDCWPRKPKKRIFLPRLSRALGNADLMSFSDTPSVGSLNKETIEVSRFPRWYHCARCQKLEYINKSRDAALADDPPRCVSGGCSKEVMAPMRFVAYCDNGHMSDIDWFSWCHRSKDATKGRCGDSSQLYFRTSGRMGGDFNAMKISCGACGRDQDLSDIQRGTAEPWMLKDRPKRENYKCCGKQPWQYSGEAVDCSESMKIEPRGSSSIYKPTVYSALDVESSDHEKKAGVETCQDLDELYEDILEDEHPSKQMMLHEISSSEGRYVAKITRRAQKNDIDFEDAVAYLIRLGKEERVASEVSAGESVDLDKLQEGILLGELEVFRRGESVDRSNLRVQFQNLNTEELNLASSVFSVIGQVKRLREVRTLVSFSRGKAFSQIPVDLGSANLKWLPSIETFGEGIYFEINPSTLKGFVEANGSALGSLVEGQQQALEVMQETYKLEIPSSPLFIMAHTLSHLLMRQLTFNSGYSSSALHERLYVDDSAGYAGILIYTTDTDSEGTLGGLVDQGRPETINNIVRQIKESALWCSSDPVCRETESQGFRNLNRSACHCCALVSETSCMFQNAMLNRLTLGGMGPSKHEVIGFLEFAAARLKP